MPPPSRELMARRCFFVKVRFFFPSFTYASFRSNKIPWLPPEQMAFLTARIEIGASGPSIHTTPLSW